MKVIVVDGIIGAGKSTMIKNVLLQGIPNSVEVAERVDKMQESGRLEQFYKDPARRALQFQIRVFHDRIKEVQTIYKNNLGADFLILERSIFTDRLFMQTLLNDGLVDATEWEDYFDLWEMWRQLMPVEPDLFVYLCPDLDICMERLHRRGREGETVSREYQATLLEEHDKFFCDNVDIGERKVPVLKITDEKNVCEKILDIINGI